MVRNVLGSILALVGAAAAVVSPFRPWNHGREGRDYRLSDLFAGSGISDVRPDQLYASLLAPFAVAALITLIGIALRSRLLVSLAGLIVLAFTVFWMVREGMARGSLTVNGHSTGLGLGLAAAAGGGVLLLLASVLMSGRHRRDEAPDASYGYADPADHGDPGDPWDPAGPPSPDPSRDSSTRTMPTLDTPYSNGPPTTGRPLPRRDPYGHQDSYGNGGSSPYGDNDPYTGNTGNNPYGNDPGGWQPPPGNRG